MIKVILWMNKTHKKEVKNNSSETIKELYDRICNHQKVFSSTLTSDYMKTKDVLTGYGSKYQKPLI